MKVIGMWVFLWVGLYAIPSANAEGDRNKLNGTWAQQAGTESNPASLWTFSPDGDAMHVIQTDGGKKIADFKCDTKGVGCDVKIAGKKVTLAMWFNGAKLIQMETSGSDVTERSFAILSNGDAMEMEIIPIVPSGKKETFEYKRVQLSAQEKR